jgi:myo-inositol-1(or 4)-monophosphatase
MAAVSGLIRVMEKAARKAGGKLRRDFGEVEHLQVSRKGPADFVSKADQVSERTIYDELLHARPDWGFELEEGGTIAGVVYQPVTDETFWAEKTRGAWLQDKRLRVSSRKNMGDALIATGIPYGGHGDFGEWTKVLGAIGPQVAGIRRYGAASLDMAWVAAGRFDGFWESDLSAWDTAAGCLLVREAGGFVTDYRGRSHPICDRQVLAANDGLHSKLHKSLAGALK